MGQAKARGTRDQRIEEAVARDSRQIALNSRRIEEAEDTSPKKNDSRLITLLAMSAMFAYRTHE